jgi:ATP-dependent DNA ligase
VVVGWTDPEGARPYIGALLLAYFDPDGRLVYAGRVGSGTGAALAHSAAARHGEHATGSTAAALQSFRIALGS